MTLWRLIDELHTPRYPVIMGILNATPDSFHAASRVGNDDLLAKAGAMLDQGAGILDIGGMSTRPGAGEIAVEEEIDRVVQAISAVHAHFPQALISVDTYRSAVARKAVEAGARMVNDIGAGLLDHAMLETVAALHVPYVVMHMQGTPRTMQQAPKYDDVGKEVVHFLSTRMAAAHNAGIADVIVDPGFGFGKTTAHNLDLFNGLSAIRALGAPVLVGISRKRMINELLGTTAAEALNGTTVLNTLAIQRGAAILRVHDVREARQAVQLVEALEKARSSEVHHTTTRTW